MFRYGAYLRGDDKRCDRGLLSSNGLVSSAALTVPIRVGEPAAAAVENQRFVRRRDCLPDSLASRDQVLVVSGAHNKKTYQRDNLHAPASQK